jgi:hypothetical protein
MNSMASAQQSEVKAWEEELVACEHALLLEQDDVPQGFQGEFPLSPWLNSLSASYSKTDQLHIIFANPGSLH